jgi:hypothetical protein
MTSSRMAISHDRIFRYGRQKVAYEFSPHVCPVKTPPIAMRGIFVSGGSRPIFYRNPYWSSPFSTGIHLYVMNFLGNLVAHSPAPLSYYAHLGTVTEAQGQCQMKLSCTILCVLVVCFAVKAQTRLLGMPSHKLQISTTPSCICQRASGSTI